MHGATLTHDLVRVVEDPLGEKGNITLLTTNVCGDTALVVEAPVLLTSKPCPKYVRRLNALVADIRYNCSTEEELVLLPALVERWLPTLHAYAEAPAETRKRILGMQTHFSEPHCIMARVASQMAHRIHQEGVFDGMGHGWSDSTAKGVALAEAEVAAVITSLLVNSTNTLPDGAKAIFDVGARFEHSCAPNTCLYVSHSQKMPLNRGVGLLPTGTWVAEWRSMRAIVSGENATVSYLDDEWLAKDGDARRQMLFMKMGFHCRCERCKLEICSLKTGAHVEGHDTHTSTLQPFLNLSALD